MEVLKLTFEGQTASFRFPQFTWGRQPTYLMPPPSTIFGLIMAAVGTWVEADALKFAYHFVYTSKSEDLEHIHAVTAGRGRFNYRSKQYPKNIEGNINPLIREFLYEPKLTLYLNDPNLLPFFQEPRYPLTLGRSQDLVALNKAEIVTLNKVSNVYFEHTILPWEIRPYFNIGYSVMMPRFIDTSQNREVQFERYILLQQRLFPNQHSQSSNNQSLIKVNGNMDDYWADPQAPKIDECYRGVYFHAFQK